MLLVVVALAVPFTPGSFFYKEQIAQADGRPTTYVMPNWFDAITIAEPFTTARPMQAPFSGAP